MKYDWVKLNVQIKNNFDIDYRVAQQFKKNYNPNKRQMCIHYDKL